MEEFLHMCVLEEYTLIVKNYNRKGAMNESIKQYDSLNTV